MVLVFQACKMQAWTVNWICTKVQKAPKCVAELDFLEEGPEKSWCEMVIVKTGSTMETPRSPTRKASDTE